MSAPEVVELAAEETYLLRREVLRRGTPSQEVAFPEDNEPGSVHLGIRVAGQVVAVSTWIPRPHNDQLAIQLRGMATVHDLQGTGIGGQLLEEGCRRVADAGMSIVWARARDAALNFYRRHGFVVEGEGFMDANTNLPHHLVVRTIVKDMT